MAPGDDGDPDVDLGESHQHGQRRRAQPEQGCTGVWSNLLAIRGENDEPQPGHQGEDGNNEIQRPGRVMAVAV